MDTLNNYKKLTELVPVRIIEDLIDEDKKLKVLLTANFQRSKNSESKQRKVASEYVRLCGYKHGDNQWSDQNELTLDEIAKQLGTSRTNLKRALRIERNLTDSMKELLDTGEITINFYVDDILVKTLTKGYQEDITHETIPLNYGKHLKIEINTGRVGNYAYYGFANAILVY